MVVILLSTYNGERYLPLQLDSLLQQDYPDWRCIVRDDGSTDKTPKILEEYSRQWPDRFFIDGAIPGNIGWKKSYARLVSLALKYDFEFVFFCDQDDVWFPNKISFMVEYARANQVDLAFSDMQVIDGYGRIKGGSFFRLTDVDPISLNWRNVLAHNPIPGMSMMVSRRAIEKLAPIPDDVAHDWWLLAGAYLFFKVGAIEERLCQYRLHGENVCGARPIVRSLLYYSTHITKARSLIRHSILIMARLRERVGKELEVEKKDMIDKIIERKGIARKFWVLYYGVLPQNYVRKIGYLLLV